MENKKKYKKIKDQEANKNNEIDNETLKNELENFLSVHEPLSKNKQKEEEILQKIKNLGIEKIKDLLQMKQDIQNSIKNDKEKNTNNTNDKLDKFYEFAVEQIKILTQEEVNNKQNKLKSDALQKENKTLKEELEASEIKLKQGEKYKSMLIEKIQAVTDDNKKILTEEAEKRKELITKCEDFMKDMQGKIEKENEEKGLLIQENTNLRQKLEECRVLIEEKLDAVQKNKSQFEETVKNDMENKLKELLLKEAITTKENETLKAQVQLYSSKFEELTKSINNYNKHYETFKKEIDKVRFI